MGRALRIVLSNDDGYPAQGIRCLYEELSSVHDVVVVAPHKENSGISHAFTHAGTIRCKEISSAEGIRRGYCVAGTPADCVKLALSCLLDQMPDIVVSGINAGENAGLAAYYSGTVAAAREAAFRQVASVAFSVCTEGIRHAAAYAKTARRIIERLVEMKTVRVQNPLNTYFYNVNFPLCPPEDIKGIIATRQSCAFFDDRYREENRGPEGTEYRLYGGRKDVEQSNAYDARAILNGYIAITPLQLDATADEAMESLREIISKETRGGAAHG